MHSAIQDQEQQLASGRGGLAAWRAATVAPKPPRSAGERGVVTRDREDNEREGSDWGGKPFREKDHRRGFSAIWRKWYGLVSLLLHRQEQGSIVHSAVTFCRFELSDPGRSAQITCYSDDIVFMNSVCYSANHDLVFSFSDLMAPM